MKRTEKRMLFMADLAIFRSLKPPIVYRGYLIATDQEYEYAENRMGIWAGLKRALYGDEFISGYLQPQCMPWNGVQNNLEILDGMEDVDEFLRAHRDSFEDKPRETVPESMQGFEEQMRRFFTREE